MKVAPSLHPTLGFKKKSIFKRKAMSNNCGLKYLHLNTFSKIVGIETPNNNTTMHVMELAERPLQPAAL